MLIAGFTNVGSFLPLRSWPLLESAAKLVWVAGFMIAGPSVEIPKPAFLGSSLSFSGADQVGGNVSITKYINVESSLSSRSRAIVGSSLFLLGGARVGGDVSVVKYVGVGSSLSSKSYACLGKTIFVVPEKLCASLGQAESEAKCRYPSTSTWDPHCLERARPCWILGSAMWSSARLGSVMLDTGIENVGSLLSLRSWSR